MSTPFLRPCPKVLVDTFKILVSSLQNQFVESIYTKSKQTIVSGWTDYELPLGFNPVWQTLGLGKAKSLGVSTIKHV